MLHHQKLTGVEKIIRLRRERRSRNPAGITLQLCVFLIDEHPIEYVNVVWSTLGFLRISTNLNVDEPTIIFATLKTSVMILKFLSCLDRLGITTLLHRASQTLRSEAT